MPAYTLIRSRRKTLSLQITPQGELVVRAPLRLSQRVIQSFLEEKAGWIAQHQQAARQRAASRAQVRREGPAGLPLLGIDYPWELKPDGPAAFDGERFLLPGREFAEGLPALEALYRALARQTLQPLTAQWSQRLGLPIQGIRITGARTRWGSCSPKGWINYSWRLVLAPPQAVEGVVVHELCHLREANHSPRFWALVREALPTYWEDTRPLSALSQQLAREGWDRAESATSE